jgi:hypothetical protein
MPPKKTTIKLTHQPNLDSKVFSVNNAKLMKTFEKMTKSIENMTKVQRDFNENYEALLNFKDEELCELDYQLKVKNEECYNHLQDLTKSFNEKTMELENEYKHKSYVLEQSHLQRIDELDRLFYDKEIQNSRKVLEDDGYTVIITKDYLNLQNELKELRDNRETFEKNTTADMHKELNVRIKTQELQHQVATSDMKAKIENQTREIQALKDTIDTLKFEIQAQRELTREVAQAGQKSVTQNFGNK